MRVVLLHRRQAQAEAHRCIAPCSTVRLASALLSWTCLRKTMHAHPGALPAFSMSCSLHAQWPLITFSPQQTFYWLAEACSNLACKNLYLEAQPFLLDLVHQVQSIQLRQALLAHSSSSCCAGTCSMRRRR